MGKEQQFKRYLIPISIVNVYLHNKNNISHYIELTEQDYSEKMF